MRGSQPIPGVYRPHLAVPPEHLGPAELTAPAQAPSKHTRARMGRKPVTIQEPWYFCAHHRSSCLSASSPASSACNQLHPGYLGIERHRRRSETGPVMKDFSALRGN